MIVNRKDLLCGLIFIVIGLLFAVGTKELPLGTAFRMGPGYFPLVLCGLLILIGLIIAVRAFGQEGTPLGGVPWRALLLILPATVIFGYTVRGLGLVPAIFLVAFSSAFASRQTTPSSRSCWRWFSPSSVRSSSRMGSACRCSSSVPG